jgi:F-type H+-transporting ATPase subunit b
MIENFLILANAGSGGVALNTDIFEANLLNIAALVVGLFIFGRKVLTNILGERRAGIEAAIKDAESRQQQAAVNLAAAKEKLAQAQTEATKIREDAVKAAANAKADIEAKAAADIARMRENAAQDTDSERERAIAQLRKQVVEMAMAKSQDRLTGLLDENAQKQLVDRSIALVGGK